MAEQLQYPCHFCRKREGTTTLLRYGACGPCATTRKDHALCPDGFCKERPKGATTPPEVAAAKTTPLPARLSFEPQSVYVEKDKALGTSTPVWESHFRDNDGGWLVKTDGDGPGLVVRRRADDFKRGTAYKCVDPEGYAFAAEVTRRYNTHLEMLAILKAVRVGIASGLVSGVDAETLDAAIAKAEAA
jgi:hypothetical protein